VSEFLDLIIKALTATGVLVSIFISLRNSKKITEVHISTNSKMDALLAVTREAAKSEGIAQGRAEMHRERAAEDKRA